MSKKFILALDQGTTGSRAFLYNTNGKIVSSAYKEFKQYYPHPGWVEHDADEIWQSCVSVIKSAVKKARISQKQIAAIGITNQRETTVMWDRSTSKPVARAIVWQCRRTADFCAKKTFRKHEALFRRSTGLVLDPYFSGTKVRWLLENVKGLRDRTRRGKVCFGTVDSWLIWKLTNGKSHVTDHTNASRTLIYNIRTKKWDKKLLKILNIPTSILPKVQNSGSEFGKTAKSNGALVEGIPITSVLGDQQAALYGQGCFKAGEVKNTYGTGCFIVLNTGKKIITSKKGLLTTLASDKLGRPVYAMEGSVFIAGAAIQWLRDELKLIKSASETEERIKGLSDTRGVYLVPAFTGLGAPYWNSEARGAITGLTRGSNDAHVIRAALESIAYQTKDVYDVMKSELKKTIPSLKVDGGAVSNDFLMQFQADMLGCNIVRPTVTETTVQGVAILAGITAGLIDGRKNIDKYFSVNRIFKPKMKKKLRDKYYSGWVNAVNRTNV